MERWGIWCREFGEAGQWLRVEDQPRLFDSFAEAGNIARQLDRKMNRREAAFSYMARPASNEPQAADVAVTRAKRRRTIRRTFIF